MSFNSNEWCLIFAAWLVSPHSLRLVARFRDGAIRTWLLRAGGINHSWCRSRRSWVWQGKRWAKGRDRRHWAKEGDIAAMPMELIDNAGSWDSLMYSAMTCYMIWSRCSHLLQRSSTALVPISSCIFSLVSSSFRLWIGRRGNSLTSFRRTLFLPLLTAFLSGRVLISSLLMSRCATSFPKNPNHIDRVNHINHRPIFSDNV